MKALFLMMFIGVISHAEVFRCSEIDETSPHVKEACEKAGSECIDEKYQKASCSGNCFFVKQNGYFSALCNPVPAKIECKSLGMFGVHITKKIDEHTYELHALNRPEIMALLKTKEVVFKQAGITTNNFCANRNGKTKVQLVNGFETEVDYFEECKCPK